MGMKAKEGYKGGKKEEKRKEMKHCRRKRRIERHKKLMN
jgi:hypothetical protein